MSEDAQIDAWVERLAREEHDALERAHGQRVLDAARDATQGRAAADRSLLDAIGRAHKAKGQE